MPRDGSGVYHTPSGTDAVTNTTISSTAYNTNVHDVETDLNTVRPIVAGGTGSNSADGALAAISGEKQKQVVNDFNVTPIVPGSFFAATSAANSPVAAHAFAGIAYLNDASNLVLEARDITDSAHMVYYRVQTGGTWGAWTVDSSGVRYDAAQTLTAAQQVQARSNIYAAPFDALSYSGLQINGSCEVSQELGTTGSSTSGAVIADGWRLSKSGTMVVSAAQYNVPGAFIGVASAHLGITVTTAQATLGSSDGVSFYQPVEGYRVARLGWGTANAQPLTIGFWTAHHRTGTYSVAFQNGAANRTCVAAYTQNVADAAEYKTITIPGDTAGTWNTGNTTGLYIIFTMANGATPAASNNQWLAGAAQVASGQVNGVAATSDVFRITGLVVLPGIELPSAARAPFIMRPYGQELTTCKRYFNKLQSLVLQGYQVTGANINESYTFPDMRVSPTIGFSNLSGISNVANIGIAAETNNNVTINITIQATGSGQITFDLTLDARL